MSLSITPLAAPRPVAPDSAPDYITFRKALERARHRYDVPKVDTYDLLQAIRGAAGDRYRSDHLSLVHTDILDIMRGLVAEPTLSDVTVGTLLVAQDYDPDAIKEVCAWVRSGKTVVGCALVHENWLAEEIDELLGNL